MSDEIKLKITLDDGSVKEGFFSIEKQADKSAKKVESSFSGAVDGISEIAPGLTSTIKDFSNKASVLLSNPFVAAGAVAAVAGLAIHKAFDLTLEGEKLIKIEKQFDSLSAAAGIAGDELKTRFIGATGGLIDDSDAIESLNKALVSLGSRAAQLPQILELSRKAANSFGGDAVQIFEAINQAVSSGATRQLKAIGININAEEAYKKYAKSIGVSVDVLSEAGKQQAILNEVTRIGEQKFKNVSAEVGGATSAYQAFKVSANNAFEEIAKSVSEKLSPAFTVALNVATGFFNDFSALIKKPSDDVDKFTERQKYLTAEIQKWQDVISRGSVGESGIIEAIFGNGAEDAQKKIDELSTELSSIDQKIENSFLKAAKTSAAVGGNKQSFSSADDPVERAKDIEKRKKLELEFTQFQFSQEQARSQSKIAQNNLALQTEIDAKSKLQLIDENFTTQEKLSEDQKNKDILAIKEKYKNEGIIGARLAAQSIAEIENTFQQQRLLQEQQRAEQSKKIQQQADFDTLSGAQQVGEGFYSIFQGAEDAAKNFSNNSVQKFKDVGATAFQVLSQGVGKAFNNFGAALKSGANAGKAFASALGESLIQIASQFGDTFIQLGIGKIAASYGADPTGYTLLAAGAALKVLAGAFGGGGANVQSSSDSGGGIASSPSASTDLTQPQQLQRQEATTSVAVTIQGDVLDSEESGSRVVALINQAFDKKGVVIRQGAFA